ncbi:MAG TPA: hypothetical protein VJV78_36135 [Polyangiales bacterium]|nr:hypothetical protein [Polyangiales bacterium]
MRKRVVVASICATLLGALIMSAFIRTCQGDDFWEREQSQTASPR